MLSWLEKDDFDTQASKKKMKNFMQRKHNQIFPVKIILVVSVRLSVNRKVKNKTKVSVHSGLGSVIML